MPDRNDRVIATTKSGTPITEDRADELAREAEEGYDLTTWKRVGRRSLAGGPGHSPRVNFRVTTDLYEQLTELAEREEKSVSQVAREALEKYVAE
jgi:hypothetical protein